MAQKNFERETIVKVDYGGRTALHSEQLEEIVLGQILLSEDAISDVMNLLKKEVFFTPKNQIIFGAMENLAKNNNTITLITVIEKLQGEEKLEEIGGPACISDLTMKVSSSAHVEHNAKLLVQKFIQRELIEVSGLISEKAFAPDCELADLTDYAEREVMNVTDQGFNRRTVQDIKQIAESVFQHIVDIKGKDIKLTGIASGFSELDRITSGWQKGNMIVIAARPGMGKTAFVLTMLRNMAVDYNVPVAMFSLEMSCEQLATRLFVSEAQIQQNALRTGQIDDTQLDKLETAKERLIKAPIFLDDTPGLSIYDFKSKCRKLVERKGVQCIVVDYLQLMNARGGNFSREQEVSTISRNIKEIAMDLQIPIIALSQLNRSVEGRQGAQGAEKEPRLSDLRESGAIEQDADMVIFIHRPAKAIRSDVDADGNDISKKSIIIVEKNRHGAGGRVELDFEGEFMKFTDHANTVIPNASDYHANNQSMIFDSQMNNSNNNDPFNFSGSLSDSPF